MRADTAHRVPALTKTAAPNPATPASVGSGKINSNCAQPTDGQTASPSPANQDIDVTLVASIGESNGESDYVESDKSSPMIPANTTDFMGHISKLEEMHEVAEGELVKIARPTVLFSRINELEIPDLDNVKTDLTETTNTMAPRRRSTPRIPCRTHPRKTPRLPLPLLRHAHALRPSTPLFKR